ncbi:Uncharacterized protein TCAP_06798 [Tolypocladium capitatum]|uniref:Uncharacterized protein n=1 Tax=Tolypocladium capitatum TaxID=45235 RepID=A0A2K3Q6W0_9HYPO|nr:Uncharacterized protein TCAP_06798 [Tolypocladium capitatum]
MDDAEDLDEPPEPRLHQTVSHKFQRTTVRRPIGQPSLLTKAILGQSDDDSHECTTSVVVNGQRRRSMASNISVASTADLTSDTGLTSPCRTNTPSPPIPEMTALRLNAEALDNKNVPLVGASSTQETPRDRPKKRCIQFACAAKPMVLEGAAPRVAPVVKTPPTQEAPRRSCIKFACAARPACSQNTPPKQPQEPTARLAPLSNPESPSTPKKSAVLPTAADTSPRPSTRSLSNKTMVSRPKFLRANSKDLVKDGSQFHEFASGMAREEDWIRQVNPAITTRLTIYDTLTKENRIRRLGAEAEEEAEQEDEEAEAAMADGDDDDDELDDGDEEEDEEDEDEESDGYYTDEETGFAESDDDDEEVDENMILWTPGHASAIGRIPGMVPTCRPSLSEPLSDSSAATNGSIRRVKPKRVKPRSEAPDLPDSTDFVCGTLDEDRPLEEAYLSCLAARRNEKLRVIPQDIDPSFPASDPDDDDEEDIYNPVAHDSDGDVWVQGEMEDLHHGQDRSRRRRKSEQASPCKYRSPAPKRHHSPAPKSRARSPAPKSRARSPAPKPRTRSPKPLFGRHSPRRARSPAAPRALTTPTGSPHQGAHVQFYLAGRPNATHTKSLPRPAALFPHMRKERNPKYHVDADVHVRGAIDIVKGLERKRQRRKEKFYQKYYNRARRGQVPERRPQPGRGAERMKELGLLMAGKKDQGNYVLSV